MSKSRSEMRKEIEEELELIIAKAIKRADWTYFNENYNRQARSVMKRLIKNGYQIVPMEPTKKMLEEGKEELEVGQHRPSDVVRKIYQAMIDAL